ncbi:hypothetical protein QJS04_geneDACA004196 [Acorus gramineus]|uniref:Cystinosin homolog n=1 Tax=Acorus gramineus TaxID=55184 RepID=A0AAV9B1Z3_ACOGR|nr:hypothetical protein QJS04_geneDACA004196 [Acorus gramineus]
MASWNSVPLEICYQTLGWIAFFSWSFSFYPQIVLNYRRKSVVGLNFDYLVLNVTKHSSYLIYNAVLFFSSVVRRQYKEKYGFDEMIPVAANDVALSTHAVLMTLFALYQVTIYERGSQKVSKICISISAVVWITAIVSVILASQSQSWLWLISVFNSIQVVMTVIKYTPQAWMNFRRKSTVGFSIGNALFDLLGGVMNFSQMGVQSIDQGNFVNFYGNIGKTLLSLEVIFYALIFIVQRYILYPLKREKFPVISKETVTPLLKSPDTEEESSNV